MTTPPGRSAEDLAEAIANVETTLADAAADIKLMMMLLCLAPYSGRNGIRGDHLLPADPPTPRWVALRIPTQRGRPTPADLRTTRYRTPPRRAR